MTELFLWILSAGAAYGGAGLLNGFTERGFRLYPEDLEHPGALGETQSRRRIFCLGTALLFSFLCLSETGLSGAGLLWGLLYMMTLSEVFMTDLEQSLIFDECPVLLLLLGLAAVLLVLGGWKGRKDPFPYGPYFAAAAMAAWLVSLPGFTDMHR